jgi:hypothetical protein
MSFAPALSPAGIESLAEDVGIPLPRNLVGRYGRRTDVRRHGHERLFAYAPPERGQGCFADCDQPAAWSDGAYEMPMIRPSLDRRRATV